MSSRVEEHFPEPGPDTGRVIRMVEHVMGIPISLALRGANAETGSARSAWAAVMADLQRADEVFSTYRAGSVICRLGRRELTLDDCPPEVREVLELAERARTASDGAFSVWLPDAGNETRLDPSGVVKGWAVERASHRLDVLADTDYCLSAGGDLTCRVVDPSRPAWRIGIEDPHQPQQIIATVEVRCGAVATSAETHRGQHIIDARTGRPPEGVASVTVIGSALTSVDVAATSAFAHGFGAAAWLRRQPGATGLVVWTDGTTTIVS